MMAARVKDQVAAVSARDCYVGEPVLDSTTRDSDADAEANFVMTGTAAS